MAPMNKKKRKNANYTAAARTDAREKHQLATSAKVAGAVRRGSRLVGDPSKQGHFTRFLLRKNDILAPNPGKKPFNYCILGFLIPFLLVGLAMLLRAIAFEEGGTKIFSMLYSDAYYQYFPFFVDFRNTIRSGESLLYTWNIGMGVDYSGLFAYYVASPLNLITVLLPESWMLDFYSFLFPVRIGLAGLFFSIFLKKLFNRNDISIAIFGTFYATCAWTFGYMWNIMWLDTFAILPLVVLGTVSLLKERKFILYTISLFFSVYANYYIGFFTCIFTLLVFICYEICRWKSLKKLLTDFCLMGVFTLLAIGMTAFLSLSTLAALQTTHSAVNEFPKAFTMHIASEQTFAAFWDAMVSVATNTYAATEPNYMYAASSGALPNIYCGLFATMLSLLFLTCKEVKWRDRICAVLVLLFLNVSFIFKQLDYIWHGFHFTNMIPNRFSFLYSFVMLYMAYRAWLLRRKIRPWQVISVSVVSFAAMFFSPGFKEFISITSSENFKKTLSDLMTNFSFVTLNEWFIAEMIFPFVNGILILLYMGALLCISIRYTLPVRSTRKVKLNWYWDRRYRRSLGTLALLAVICLELVFNIVSFGLQFNAQDATAYPRGGEDSKKVISYMKEHEGENSFYRADAAQIQTYNDGALNNYNGISTFSSSANVNVTNYLRALGHSGFKTYNRIAYSDSSPLVNMFLNLKYVLERQNFVEDNHYLTDVYSSGRVHLMENNYYLPVGFMVDPELAELSFADQNGTFYFQNQFLSAALGEQVSAWKVLDQSKWNITWDSGVTVDPTPTGGTVNYSKDSKGNIKYTYTFEDEGLYCAKYSMQRKNKYDVQFKAAGSDKFVRLHNETHNSLGYITTVCQVKPGDQVRIIVTCKAGKSTDSHNITIGGAILNEDVMKKAYSKLSQSTLQVTSFEDTRIAGTIDCKTPGLMYTSIPQSGTNWHVYVDGKEAEITLVGDTMIGVMLTEGKHDIVFQYKNRAFEIGLIISIACAVIFSAICIYVYVFFNRSHAIQKMIHKIRIFLKH